MAVKRNGTFTTFHQPMEGYFKRLRSQWEAEIMTIIPRFLQNQRFTSGKKTLLVELPSAGGSTSKL